MRRNRRTGRFKRYIVKADNKRAFLEQYYEQHKKQIDKAVDIYKERHNLNFTNKRIFVDRLYYGTSEWHGVKTAKKVINRTLHYMRYGSDSLEYYDATHRARENTTLKDLRKFNNKKPGQFIYKDQVLATAKNGAERTLEGYYDVPGTDYVLAKVLYQYNRESPTEDWEYVRRDEIGI